MLIRLLLIAILAVGVLFFLVFVRRLLADLRPDDDVNTLIRLWL